MGNHWENINHWESLSLNNSFFIIKEKLFLGVPQRYLVGQACTIVESSYEKKEGYLEQIDTFCFLPAWCRPLTPILQISKT